MNCRSFSLILFLICSFVTSQTVTPSPTVSSPPIPRPNNTQEKVIILLGSLDIFFLFVFAVLCGVCMFNQIKDPCGKLSTSILKSFYEFVLRIKEKISTPSRNITNKIIIENGKSAVSLSGGGIRSASFNLGVLRGFANNQFQYDYLSTVSGGGFTGCAAKMHQLDYIQKNHSHNRQQSRSTAEDQMVELEDPSSVSIPLSSEEVRNLYFAGFKQGLDELYKYMKRCPSYFNITDYISIAATILFATFTNGFIISAIITVLSIPWAYLNSDALISSIEIDGIDFTELFQYYGFINQIINHLFNEKLSQIEYLSFVFVTLLIGLMFCCCFCISILSQKSLIKSILIYFLLILIALTGLVIFLSLYGLFILLLSACWAYMIQSISNANDTELPTVISIFGITIFILNSLFSVFLSVIIALLVSVIGQQFAGSLSSICIGIGMIITVIMTLFDASIFSSFTGFVFAYYFECIYLNNEKGFQYCKQYEHDILLTLGWTLIPFSFYVIMIVLHKSIFTNLHQIYRSALVKAFYPKDHDHENYAEKTFFDLKGSVPKLVVNTTMNSDFTIDNITIKSPSYFSFGQDHCYIHENNNNSNSDQLIDHQIAKSAYQVDSFKFCTVSEAMAASGAAVSTHMGTLLPKIIPLGLNNVAAFLLNYFGLNLGVFFRKYDPVTTYSQLLADLLFASLYVIVLTVYFIIPWECNSTFCTYITIFIDIIAFFLPWIVLVVVLFNGPIGNRISFVRSIRFSLGMKNMQPYTFHSDGGHYDNLGVYSMLVRGVSEIYAFDVEEDPDRQCLSLANVLNLAVSHDIITPDWTVDSSLLGLQDTIHSVQDENGKGSFEYLSKLSRSRHLIISLKYKSPNDHQSCTIYYTKATVCFNDETKIIFNKISDPNFPHHPTANQNFTEDLFQMYHDLGYISSSSIVKLIAKQKETEIVEFVEHVE